MRLHSARRALRIKEGGKWLNTFSNIRVLVHNITSATHNTLLSYRSTSSTAGLAVCQSGVKNANNVINPS